MTPESFQDLLDQATEEPPPAPAPGAEVAEGRRRLLRRRLGSAVAGAVAAAVVVGGALAVTTGADPGHAEDPVAEAPRADNQASLLDSCRDGNQSRDATQAVFGPGTPLVKNVVQTDFEIVLALESADGAHWGACWIHLLSAEFGSGMSVYPSDPTVQDQGVSSEGTSYTTGGGCALVDGDLPAECPMWFVQWVDRLPSAVAAVRFELADGTTTTVPSRDGYVILNVLDPVAGAVSYDPEDGLEVVDAIPRIYYLDAAGDPIAAQDSGRPQLDGLPPLSAYPSIRGAEQY
jgi:hypothetical protein